MDTEIRIVRTAAMPFAAVVLRTTFSRLPKETIACYDALYSLISAGKLTKQGHNIAMYRNVDKNEVDVEIGVQVSAPFEDLGQVVFREIPAGSAATLTYYGPYSGLPAAHSSVIEWARKTGAELAGVNWEIYGDWSDDPAQLRTDIFHLLAPA